uniref:Uncharacterized protein n=1 Tax=Leviviridae sp. TaxID=2027243 RepID=A0A514DCY9_9VIRU|nr:MAG: hypothetical protein H4Bulk46879_000003 [Leviviridae sp.]
MFSDPQSVTYATVAKSLPTIGRDGTSSEYRLNDSGVVYDFTLSHQFKPARTRAVARLQRDSFVANPVTPTQNVLASMTSTLTMDFPTAGLTPADAQSLATALVTWATPSNLLRLANGET